MCLKVFPLGRYTTIIQKSPRTSKICYTFSYIYKQINIGNQNRQQIGQNPENQPIIPQEKPRIN